MAAASIGYFFDFTYDDSYIYYRYIDNFAAGHGFVFNIGERLEGYSSFLWLLIVGFAKILTGFDTIILAKSLGITLLCATLMLLHFVIAREAAEQHGRHEVGDLVSAGLALSVFLTPTTILWAYGGLENGAWGLVLLAYVACVSRWWTVGSCVAVCALSITRVESIAFAALPLALGLVECFLTRRQEGGFGAALKTHFLYERRNFYVAFFGCLLVFVGAMTAFRLYYFEVPMPSTFYLKKPVGLFTSIAKGLLYIKSFATNNPAFTIAFAISVMMGWVWLRNRLFLGAMLVVVAQLLFVSWVGGDWMEQTRFLSAFVPLMAVNIGGALLWFLSRGGLAAYLAAIVSIGLMLATIPSAYSIYERVAQTKGHGSLLEQTKRVGLFLNRSTTPGALIAVGDAGMIPYYSKRSIIDLHGLLDKHLINYVGDFTNAGHSDIDADYVFSKNPAWVVLIGNNSYFINNVTKPTYPLYGVLRDHPAFEKNYNFHSEYEVTYFYFYQLYYDKRQVKNFKIDIDLRVDANTDSRAEIYINNDFSKPFVKLFKNQERTKISVDSVRQGLSAIRFDPTSVSKGRITLYSIKVQLEDEYVVLEPKEISQLQTRNLKFRHLSHESAEFEITGSDPIFIFDSVIKRLNEIDS